MKEQSVKRVRHTVSGQVQGVGFRPFVFLLAEELGLTGEVKNAPEGVIVEVQGQEKALDAFGETLFSRLPPLARITFHEMRKIPVRQGETSFSISRSRGGSSHAVLVSPDISLCPDCLNDMEDREGRRHGYAFTNCTNCGPRYTITRSVPYDRATTSMACFPLCDQCREEYENPRDRRFHAQPNACPLCGPKVWFTEGNTVDASFFAPENACAEGDDALARLATFLAEGGIAAVKGLGGFHLACNAGNEEAVARLRQKKNRPHKPLAVMTDSLASARRFALVDERAKRLLLSAERPVTLCPMHGETACHLADGIASDTRTIGIMLPYTPLHYMLFKHYADRCSGAVPVLVMTSGNKGGEPICLGNREAVVHLSGIAEGWLFHDRDILIRVDDSVVMPLEGAMTGESVPEAVFLRRARGYVPRPLALAPFVAKGLGEASKNSLSHDSNNRQPASDTARLPVVLGVGAELKNTLCITKGNDAFVSQHIGDMANVETERFHQEIALHLESLLAVTPELAVRDLHPDYLSSRLAEASGLPVMRLQHHAAHGFSVLGEHRFTGEALVLALDGTGLGEDGALWGGEALAVDMQRGIWRRLGRLSPLPLPGGESAIREPWRIAHALMVQRNLPVAGAPWLQEYAPVAAHIPLMVEKGLNTPFSSSCGRLFDAVSAMLGLCLCITYEGQAAVRLEQAQWADRPLPGPGEANSSRVLPAETIHPFPLYEENGLFTLDSEPVFDALYRDRAAGAPAALLARRFHQSLAAGLATLAETLCKAYGFTHVGLSGGSMQNSTLLTLLWRDLATRGLTPLAHRELPPGDGCISFGQALWGRLQLLETRGEAALQDGEGPIS